MNQDKLVMFNLEEAEKAVEVFKEAYPNLDRYQERAKKNGITREEAKSKMFSEDYGSGSTGVKDWKKDLKRLIVRPE